jgi:hypothetical protein
MVVAAWSEKGGGEGSHGRRQERLCKLVLALPLKEEPGVWEVGASAGGPKLHVRGGPSLPVSDDGPVGMLWGLPGDGNTVFSCAGGGDSGGRRAGRKRVGAGGKREAKGQNVKKGMAISQDGLGNSHDLPRRGQGWWPFVGAANGAGNNSELHFPA